jgi:CHAD domain-containing protein
MDWEFRVKKIWKLDRTLKDNLQRYLPLAVTEYFDAGRLAMAPHTTWEDMHAFRLQTKRFRYTLEVFRDAYGPALETRIDSLRKVQTFLGEINDCVVTSSMLAEVPGTEGVREALARRAAAKTEKLRRFWTRTLDASRQLELWKAYLGRYACRPKRQPRTRRLAAPEVT